jgi:hypothetical protein
MAAARRKQVGSSEATSRGSPELKPSGSVGVRSPESACFLFVRLRRSYFQCANNARFTSSYTSFGTSSEAKRKQHAAVYLISICCSAKGCKDQLLLLANIFGLLFIYFRSTALCHLVQGPI